MWHRVRPTGRPEDGMLALTREAELVRRDNETWAIVDGGVERATFSADRLRVSLSWKALAFSDEADRRRHDEHTDDIDLDEVVRRFAADFAARGEPLDIPSEPTTEPAFVRRLSDAYVRYPG
jgi:hypothetical protein